MNRTELRNGYLGKLDMLTLAKSALYFVVKVRKYVVEVKRQKRIGVEVVHEVEQKIDRLPLRKGLSVRPALVYEGELAPSVTGCGFFDAIIPVEKMLNI